MRLLIAFLMILILAGCAGSEFKSEISEIDSLQTALVKSDSVILSLDTAEIYRRLNTQLDALNKIQSELDSIPRKEAFILDKYAQYKKAYSRWGEKIPVFFNEIELRKDQLADLKKDLENNRIKKDEAIKYLENEKMHVRDVTAIIEEMSIGLRSIDSLYLNSQKRVDSIMARLKENPGQ